MRNSLHFILMLVVLLVCFPLVSAVESQENPDIAIANVLSLKLIPVLHFNNASAKIIIFDVTILQTGGIKGYCSGNDDDSKVYLWEKGD